MNGKRINFDNKNIKKSDFYNQNKKIFNIDDIDVNKILVSKKEQYVEYNSFKYFIGYMVMMLLDHYIYLFHKRLDILINLKKIMSLMIKDIQLLKNYNKIWKKLKT